MVRIRLRKPGKPVKHRYHFLIVACDAREGREGRVLEVLGYYDPSKNPVFFDLKLDRIEDWIKKGAQPTDTVKSLIKKARKLKKAEVASKGEGNSQ